MLLWNFRLISFVLNPKVFGRRTFGTFVCIPRMPIVRKNKFQRNRSTKDIKLAEEAVSAFKRAEVVTTHQRKCVVQIKKVAEDIADQLAACPWQTHLSRPRVDLTGYYLIAKWYPKQKEWAVLYLGYGRVQQKLNMHFSARRLTPIDNYLASFSKSARSQLWTKWLGQQPSHAQDVSLEDVIVAVQHLYNQGERPAFNLEPSAAAKASSPPVKSCIFNW